MARSHRRKFDNLNVIEGEEPEVPGAASSITRSQGESLVSLVKLHPYFKNPRLVYTPPTPFKQGRYTVEADSQFCKWIFQNEYEYARAKESMEQVLGIPGRRGR